MSRLFIAIVLPQEVKKILKQCQDQIRKIGWVDGTFSKPENIHLTLKFLGEVEQSQMPSFISALKNIEAKAFSLELNRIGKFPEEGRSARVIWMSAEGDALVKLAEGIENALLDIAAPSEHPFKPHLTLLRVKRVIDRKKSLADLQKILFERIEFPVNEFSLIKSELSSLGPKYQILETFRL